MSSYNSQIFYNIYRGKLQKMIEREIAYPVEPYQIYLGFIITASIFLVLYYLQKMKKQASYQQKYLAKNTGTRYHFSPGAKSSSQQKSQFPAKTKINNNSQMRLSKMQQENRQQKIYQKLSKIIQQNEVPNQQRDINRIKEQKAKDPKQTFKQLSKLAYNYSKNEYMMQKILRSEEQIQKQRQIYIIRKQKPKEQKEKQKRSTIESDRQLKGLELKKQNQRKYKQQKERIKKMKLIQNQQKSRNITENPKNKNKDDEMNNIVNPYSGQNPKKELPIPSINAQSNKPFSFENPKITPPTENKTIVTPPQNKPQPPPPMPLNLFPKSNTIKEKVGEITQKSPVQQQSTQVKKLINNASETQNNKNPIVPETTTKTVANNSINNIMPIKKQQPKPQASVEGHQEKQKPKQIETKLPTIIQQSQSSKIQTKIETARDYIDAISKYSQTFKLKTQIATNISNLSGAVSDPRQLWLFASSYIKTIDTNNHDQAVTFSFRIWQAIVYKFIKNTNVKDGFERMPPKQRNRQVQKNSINKYILLLNIYRVMGHQAIWLGAFGKTLKMIEFIYKRKDPIKKWGKLQLIENRYIPLDGDLNSKYLSRIDFLTYFLLGLATFDPISVFEEVSQKTGEVYPFIQELKKYKHKWSYRQFWCLVQTIKSNKFDGYFKIPFWNNTLTAIYLPLLKNMKEGSMKEFVNLSKWIKKQVKQQTKKFEKTPEAEFLRKEQFESQGGEYQFDGDQFVSSIIGMGREMEYRERRMRSLKWEDFRNQYSIFYYFWRLDT